MCGSSRALNPDEGPFMIIVNTKQDRMNGLNNSMTIPSYLYMQGARSYQFLVSVHVADMKIIYVDCCCVPRSVVPQ